MLLSIISQSFEFCIGFTYHERKEELMSPSNVPLIKDLRTNITIQRKTGTVVLKLKFKDKNTKRQRMILSVNAGHVRGGHSFL